MKKYRFFYHYNKHTKKLIIHYKKECIPVNNIVCSVKVESKWNKTQPHLVMQGFAKQVKVENNIGYII